MSFNNRSFPGMLKHFVDLDHPDCPSTGNPEQARTDLKSHGLDIVWDVIHKTFVFVRWTHYHGVQGSVPAIVWRCANPQTGEPWPLNARRVAEVVKLHKNRVSLERQAMARVEAEKDKQRQVRDGLGVQAEQTLKGIRDTHGENADGVTQVRVL